jgi:cytosine/adenosine deaminase-related metal-dependent hydrolase
MEAAHTARSIYASARLGIAELIRGGTTCALTMETVNHTEAVFNAVEESGFRATIGKCMMDKGDDVPASAQGANGGFHRGIPRAVGTLARSSRRQDSLLPCAAVRGQLHARIVGARSRFIASARGDGSHSRFRE